MDDMQFSKYSCDIREILSKTDREGLETLVRNAVAYAQSNNRIIFLKNIQILIFTI